MALTTKQIDALMKLVPEVLVHTDVGLDEPIAQHAVGVRPYIDYMMRRFQSVRDQFMAPMKAGAAMATTPRGADGTPDEYAGEIAFLKALDLPGSAEVAINDRYESETAFVALTLCHPTNLRELQVEEAKLARLPEEIFDKLYVGAQRATYGEDLNPKDFMKRVAKKSMGMDLTTLFSLPQPDETDATA